MYNFLQKSISCIYMSKMYYTSSNLKIYKLIGLVFFLANSRY